MCNTAVRSALPVLFFVVFFFAWHTCHCNLRICHRYASHWGYGVDMHVYCACSRWRHVCEYVYMQLWCVFGISVHAHVHACVRLLV